VVERNLEENKEVEEEVSSLVQGPTHVPYTPVLALGGFECVSFLQSFFFYHCPVLSWPHGPHISLVLRLDAFLSGGSTSPTCKTIASNRSLPSCSWLF
jgi:hypothetical protein